MKALEKLTGKEARVGVDWERHGRWRLGEMELASHGPSDLRWQTNCDSEPWLPKDISQILSLCRLKHGIKLEPNESDILEYPAISIKPDRIYYLKFKHKRGNDNEPIDPSVLDELYIQDKDSSDLPWQFFLNVSNYIQFTRFNEGPCNESVNMTFFFKILFKIILNITVI